MAINNGLPPSPDDLARRLERIERKQRELEARTLNNATIPNLPGAGIRSSDFDGTGFANPGTQGVYLGGDGAVLNHVFFQPGSISNDWLATPLAVGFGSNTGSNFAVGTSATVVTYWDIPVPAGFTQAVVHVTVNATCKNTTAAADFLYVSAMAVTGSGGEAYAAVAAGSYGSAAASAGQKVTGLSGGSNLRVSARVRAGTAWAADPSNIANVDAIAIFLR